METLTVYEKREFKEWREDVTLGRWVARASGAMASVTEGKSLWQIEKNQQYDLDAGRGV